MSYFGNGTIEKDILDDVLYRQASFKRDDSEVVKALTKVIGYFTEVVSDNQELNIDTTEKCSTS